jgi:hypothetical protein
MSTVRITPGTTRVHAYPWEDAAWIESVAHDLNRAPSTFDVVRVDPHEVTRDLVAEVGHVVTAYPEDFAPFGEHRAPSRRGLAAMYDAVGRWMRGIKTVTEDKTMMHIAVPLCAFNCPDVADAKTSFAESNTTEKTAGWSIEVLGSGFGSDVTLSVSQTNLFAAGPGERKLVFAPLQVRVECVAVYKRDQYLDRFLRCEVVESSVREANGVRLVDHSEWRNLIGGGRPVERFDLSGDKSGSVTTYERSHELSGSFEAKLGLEAYHLKSSVTAKCKAKESVALKFELPGGRLYVWQSPTALSGFYFD